MQYSILVRALEKNYNEMANISNGSKIWRTVCILVILSSIMAHTVSTLAELTWGQPFSRKVKTH